MTIRNKHNGTIIISDNLICIGLNGQNFIDIRSGCDEYTYPAYDWEEINSDNTPPKKWIGPKPKIKDFPVYDFDKIKSMPDKWYYITEKRCAVPSETRAVGLLIERKDGTFYITAGMYYSNERYFDYSFNIMSDKTLLAWQFLDYDNLQKYGLNIKQ